MTKNIGTVDRLIRFIFAVAVALMATLMTVVARCVRRGHDCVLRRVRRHPDSTPY